MKSLYVAAVLGFLAAWLHCGYSNTICDKKQTACSCVGTNISSINVEAVLKDSTKKAIKDPDHPTKYDYMVNFCSGLTCKNDKDDDGKDVGKEAVACQEQIDGLQNVSSKLGDVKQHSWQVFDNDTFAIMYAGGDVPGTDGSRAAMLYVYVAKKTEGITFDELTFVEERKSGEKDKDHVYVFDIHITPNQVNSGGGGGGNNNAGAIGLAIVFIAIAAVIAYFIIGSIVMYAVKGARGIEIIPNYSFWKALPIYLKDGFMFTISPCMKLAGRGKSGYQSL